MKRLLAVLILLGCAEFGPPDELAAARKRWESRGLASYDLSIIRMCECVPEAFGPATVYVRNGVVEWRGVPVASVNEAELFPDVPGLFEQIAAAVAEGHLGSVEYDFATGYPKEIVFDYDGPETNGTDGEIVMQMKLRVP